MFTAVSYDIAPPPSAKALSPELNEVRPVADVLVVLLYIPGRLAALVAVDVVEPVEFVAKTSEPVVVSLPMKSVK